MVAKSLILPKRAKDHTGVRFGRLTAVKPVGKSPSGRNIIWECFCDCTETVHVSSHHLTTGSTKSCGCHARELSSKRIKALHHTGKHLYIIRCNEFIKIGRANDVRARLSSIQASNPYELELISVLEDQGHREKELHEKFKDKLIRGEWFHLNNSELEEIARSNL